MPLQTINNLLAKSLLANKKDAENILSHVLGLTREKILAHPDLAITNEQAKLYLALAKRRKNGEPLAYVLRQQPFFGLNFLVNKDVLIPRPESEWLVEKALQTLKTFPTIKTVVDLGTGSGCLIISVVKTLATNNPEMSFYGTDISKFSLRLAKKNASRHNLKNITWLEGDLLQPLIKVFKNTKTPILLIANLPYLSIKGFKKTPNEVKNFEPKIALEAGKDGLKYYQNLILSLKSLTNNSFKCLWEIDPSHGKNLASLVTKNFPGSSPKISKDFNNFNRYLTVRIPK